MKKFFKLNNKGFSHLEIGLVVVVFLVLGLVGYAVYKNQSHAGSGYSGYTRLGIPTPNNGIKLSIDKTTLVPVSLKIPKAIEQSCPTGQEVPVASEGNGPYTTKPCVKKLQFILNNYLGISNATVSDPVDGMYGPKTQATVDKFAAKWKTFANENKLAAFDNNQITKADWQNVLDKLEAKKTSSVSFYACAQPIQNSSSADYIFKGKVVDTNGLMAPTDNVYMVDLPTPDWGTFTNKNSWLNKTGLQAMAFDYAGLAVNVVNAGIHLTNGALSVVELPVQAAYDVFSGLVWGLSFGNVHLGTLSSETFPTFGHPVNYQPNYVTLVHGTKYVQKSKDTNSYTQVRVGDANGGVTGFINGTKGSKNYIGMVYVSGDGHPVYTNLVQMKYLLSGCN